MAEEINLEERLVRGLKIREGLALASETDLERELLTRKRHGPSVRGSWCVLCRNLGRTRIPWVKAWVACEGGLLPAWTGFVIRDVLPDVYTRGAPGPTGCALCLPIPLNVPVHFLFWLATRWTRRLRAWWREHGR